MAEHSGVSRRGVLQGAALAVGGAIVLPALTASSADAADAPAKVLPDKDGWLATMKVADLKNNSLHAVDGQPVALARGEKTVIALSTICTHKGCKVAPSKRDQSLFECPCHRARFDAQGDVKHGPAGSPLSRLAIRLKDGVIEVNVKTKVKADDKAGSIEVE